MAKKERYSMTFLIPIVNLQKLYGSQKKMTIWRLRFVFMLFIFAKEKLYSFKLK